MATLHLPGKAKQATIHISTSLVDALDWRDKDILLVSKPVGQRHLVIENISGEKRQK